MRTKIIGLPPWFKMVFFVQFLNSPLLSNLIQVIFATNVTFVLKLQYLKPPALAKVHKNIRKPRWFCTLPILYSRYLVYFIILCYFDLCTFPICCTIPIYCTHLIPFVIFESLVFLLSFPTNGRIKIVRSDCDFWNQNEISPLTLFLEFSLSNQIKSIADLKQFANWN